MSGNPRAKLWIGPAGWSYEDWHGIVYPQPQPRRFDPLEYLARYVNAVEVNTSFYRIPSARMTRTWPRRVPPAFRFSFKLTRIFTHDPPGSATRDDADAFREALEPIRQAGRLGPLLIQFPWSFRYGQQAVERLEQLKTWFPDCDRIIEVRHSSWARPEALEAIGRIGGLCNIDQPRLRACLRPTSHVFGPVGYVRLHGRNAAKWFAENIEPHERYDYLYSEQELAEWARRIEDMMGQARELYVIANNHYRGQGVVNALELRAMLEHRRVEVPQPLIETYPRLRHIATTPHQRGLFDTRTE